MKTKSKKINVKKIPKNEELVLELISILRAEIKRLKTKNLHYKKALKKLAETVDDYDINVGDLIDEARQALAIDGYTEEYWD